MVPSSCLRHNTLTDLSAVGTREHSPLACVVSNMNPPPAIRRLVWRSDCVLLAALTSLASSAPGFAQTVPSVLPDTDFSHPTETRLPTALEEISGLAISEDGRLYAHDDERGVVYELNPETGEIVHHFTLAGRPRGDFEGLAMVGDTFYMITSGGTLLSFPRDAEAGSVPYSQRPTGLRRTCEIEGLAADVNRTLLIACKTLKRRRDRGKLVVFRWDIDGEELDPTPVISVSREDLEAHGLKRGVHPSGIETTPHQTFLVLASRENVLLEISADGLILSTVELSDKQHRQPEGIALWPNGMITIADEKQGRRPRLTHYRPKSER